jgi:hypothetical protein
MGRHQDGRRVRGLLCRRSGDRLSIGRSRGRPHARCLSRRTPSRRRSVRGAATLHRGSPSWPRRTARRPDAPHLRDVRRPGRDMDGALRCLLRHGRVSVSPSGARDSAGGSRGRRAVPVPRCCPPCTARARRASRRDSVVGCIKSDNLSDEAGLKACATGLRSQAATDEAGLKACATAILITGFEVRIQRLELRSPGRAVGI